MALDGTQISHYWFLRLIGKGRMGEVYLAEDLSGLRQVALKVLTLEAEASNQEATDEMLRLFRREAAAITSLDHAHMLPLYDYG